MASFKDKITDNLVYLTENISNLDAIITRLMQKRIISEDEAETIESEKTSTRKNRKLLLTLTKKSPSTRNIFVKILCDTKNFHCAKKIKLDQNQRPEKTLVQKKETTWWPQQKYLPTLFCERHVNGVLLVNKLYDVFFGRDSLKKLPPNNNSSLKIACITGNSGVGKSSLAIWFANVFQMRYQYIFWINCGGEESLLSTFQSIGKILEIPDMSNLRVQNLAKKCFDQCQHMKCLWIYDDTDTIHCSEGIGNVLPKHFNNHVIVTTHNKDWQCKNGYQVVHFHLGVFTPTDAVNFAEKCSNVLQKVCKRDLTKLCTLLGNSPLALQIAFNTLKETKIQLLVNLDRLNTLKHLIPIHFDSFEKSIGLRNVLLNVVDTNSIRSGDLHPCNIKIAFMASFNDLVAGRNITAKQGKSYHILCRCLYKCKTDTASNKKDCYKFLFIDGTKKEIEGVAFDLVGKILFEQLTVGDCVQINEAKVEEKKFVDRGLTSNLLQLVFSNVTAISTKLIKTNCKVLPTHALMELWPLSEIVNGSHLLKVDVLGVIVKSQVSDKNNCRDYILKDQYGTQIVCSFWGHRKVIRKNCIVYIRGLQIYKSKQPKMGSGDQANNIGRVYYSVAPSALVIEISSLSQMPFEWQKFYCEYFRSSKKRKLDDTDL